MFRQKSCIASTSHLFGSVIVGEEGKQQPLSGSTKGNVSLPLPLPLTLPCVGSLSRGYVHAHPWGWLPSLALPHLQAVGHTPAPYGWVVVYPSNTVRRSPHQACPNKITGLYWFTHSSLSLQPPPASDSSPFSMSSLPFFHESSLLSHRFPPLCLRPHPIRVFLSPLKGTPWNRLNNWQTSSSWGSPSPFYFGLATASKFAGEPPRCCPTGEAGSTAQGRSQQELTQFWKWTAEFCNPTPNFNRMETNGGKE